MITPLARAFAVERVTRIELAWPAWKTKPREALARRFPHIQRNRLTMTSREYRSCAV
jgi:hypothetical protein